MIVCQNLPPLREQIKIWRDNNKKIAFVPTMGNLHAGHLSLVELAQQNADQVVVSIYVNPLQFSPDEDFSSYPRTMQEDLEKLEALNVDLVFTPDSSLIYPQGDRESSFIEMPLLTHIVEGEFRPHFFRGVATVVLKLFNMVQPDIAVFGEKDYQQLLIIKQMVADLQLPIEIIGGETTREADGLAMSSRNNYLTDDEREKSQLLSQSLMQFRQEVEQGGEIKQAQQTCIENLNNHDFLVDYITLRETSRLAEVSQQDIQPGLELILLAAIKIGKTRLIDNVKFTVES